MNAITGNREQGQGHVALVYIARGIGAGLAAAEAFFDAYRRYPPGCSHRLVVIAKGWEGVQGLRELVCMAKNVSADLEYFPDDGFDWGAYIRICRRLGEEWLCLLNSHSRPAVINWLEILRRGAAEPGVGAVGSTGSWGSWSFSWPILEYDAKSFFFFPARLGHELFLHFRYFGMSAPFPNPHLRSNAMLIRQELFLEFCERSAFPYTKRDAHMLESGWGSLTRHLLACGLEVRVMGADGKAFAPNEWIESSTFRVPGQTNLLVRDNQTENYAKADRQRRRRLEYRAWGVALTS